MFLSWLFHQGIRLEGPAFFGRQKTIFQVSAFITGSSQGDKALFPQCLFPTRAFPSSGGKSLLSKSLIAHLDNAWVWEVVFGKTIHSIFHQDRSILVPQSERFTGFYSDPGGMAQSDPSWFLRSWIIISGCASLGQTLCSWGVASFEQAEFPTSINS